MHRLQKETLDTTHTVSADVSRLQPTILWLLLRNIVQDEFDPK